MMQCNANLPSGGMSEVHDMDAMHQSDSGVLQCSLFHDPQNGGDAGPIYAQLDVRYLGRSEKIGIDLRKKDYTAQVRRQLRYWDSLRDFPPFWPKRKGGTRTKTVGTIFETARGLRVFNPSEEHSIFSMKMVTGEPVR